MALPKVSFLARMSRDTQLQYSGSGVAFCKVGLVCSEKYQDKETSLFIDGTCFKKTAEMIATIPKGKRVFVIGKIQTESWDDKQSGQKRSKTTMIIESFEFIEPRQDQNQNTGFQNQNPVNNGFSNNNSGFQNNTQTMNNSNQGNNQVFQQQTNPDGLPF